MAVVGKTLLRSSGSENYSIDFMNCKNHNLEHIQILLSWRDSM